MCQMELQGSAFDQTSHSNPAIRVFPYCRKTYCVVIEPKILTVVAQMVMQANLEVTLEQTWMSDTSNWVPDPLHQQQNSTGNTENNTDILEHWAGRKHTVEASDSGLYWACKSVCLIWRRHLSLSDWSFSKLQLSPCCPALLSTHFPPQFFPPVSPDPAVIVSTDFRLHCFAESRWCR